MTREQQLVDQLIDRGLGESPATDWSLTLPEEWLPLLPIEGNELRRPDNAGRPGYFRCPMYRDRELVAIPLTKPVLILSDASGYLDSLYMNTETGQIGHDMIEIGLVAAPTEPTD